MKSIYIIIIIITLILIYTELFMFGRFTFLVFVHGSTIVKDVHLYSLIYTNYALFLKYTQYAFLHAQSQNLCKKGTFLSFFSDFL